MRAGLALRLIHTHYSVLNITQCMMKNLIGRKESKQKRAERPRGAHAKD